MARPQFISRLALVGALLMGFAVGGVAVADIDFDAAVGIWLFDEGSGDTTEDLSPSIAHGALVGGAAWVDGKFGQAIEFDGTSACVETGQQLLESVTDFSITAWIKTPGTAGNRVGLIGQNDTVEFGLINPTTLQLWSEGGGGSIDAVWTDSDDEWHHIAGTGTPDTLRLFVDGVMSEQPLPTPDHGTSAFNVNIGGCGVFDGTGNWFTGAIDDVAIFHTALGEDEIREIMDIGFDQSLAVSSVGKAAVTWAALKTAGR